MTTDARTEYTITKIREVFFDLLKDTPLNKITVTSICEKAKINRSTFYRYYADPLELLEIIENDLILSFESYVQEFKNKNIEIAMKTMIDAVKQDKELYLILVSENADSLFINRIISKSYSLFQEDFEKRFLPLSKDKCRWLYLFIAHGCINVIIDWIDGGMKENTKELAAFLSNLDQQLFLHIQ